jgi:hypothetical protein
VLAREEVARRFARLPEADGGRVCAPEDIRAGCGSLAQAVNALLPEGAEKARALLLTEQVLFWSDASTVRESKES